jgi:hypothetical protein
MCKTPVAYKEGLGHETMPGYCCRHIAAQCLRQNFVGGTVAGPCGRSFARCQLFTTETSAASPDRYKFLPGGVVHEFLCARASVHAGDLSRSHALAHQTESLSAHQSKGDMIEITVGRLRAGAVIGSEGLRASGSIRNKWARQSDQSSR